MFLYDPIHHRQAETGPLFGIAGCEKGLEDPLLNLLGDTASGICNR